MSRAGEDSKELEAREVLRAFFADQPGRVFYQRQVAVLFERQFFHWITDRALKSLVAEGFLKVEKEDIPGHAGYVNVYSLKKLRYNKRAVKELVGLVGEFSQDHVAASLGQSGELLVLAGLALKGFQPVAHEANAYGGQVWDKSAHDLDYIFEKDGQAYGVEIKNKLPYIDQDEFKVKIAMCLHLGIRPVFVCRAIPGSYIVQLHHLGGFGLVFAEQLYPLHLKELTERIRAGLQLPAAAPKRLNDAILGRFEGYHQRNVDAGLWVPPEFAADEAAAKAKPDHVTDQHPFM